MSAEHDVEAHTLQKLGEPILDLGRPVSIDAQRTFDTNLRKGRRYLSKAHELDWISNGAIDRTARTAALRGTDRDGVAITLANAVDK